MKIKQHIEILIAEDDDDDYMLTTEAMQEVRVLNKITRVVDGEDLLHYLNRTGNYTHLKGTPLPGLILLDLNMPKVDGIEVMRILNKRPEFRRIPIIVLTTSKSQEDIFKSYELGCNSYIRKPVQFDELIRVMKDFKRYWIEIVSLPADEE